MVCLNKSPLFNEQCSLYTGGICHKEFFIFLNPRNCQVDVFSHCLKKVGSIKTENYQSITENKKDCYFLLTKENDKDHLYKATYDFLEFDSIELHVPNQYKTAIHDIYYNEGEKQIVIATDRFVYTITIDGYFVKEIAAQTTPVTSSMMIRTLNGCCMKPQTPPRSIFSFTAVGFCEHLYVAYQEKEHTYLNRLEEENCVLDHICLGKNIQVVSIFVCCNRLYLLVIKNGRYNYLYETDICCSKCPREGHFSCCQSGCEELCHGCGDKCCHGKECHGYPLGCCKDPSACLLESIALIETSLSHILNAEGEKIQKAIADDASICELLEINNSVTESIFNVTMLEHALQKKMEKTLQYDKCHKKHDDCCKDH